MKTHLTILVLILVACPAALTSAYDAKSQSWTGTVRGEVIKVEAETFIVQDTLGRQVRLSPSKDCMRDENIQVGDEIVARVVHKGKETSIKSMKKLLSSPIISSSPSGISPVVEGEVLKIEGESYLVKDIAGREVRLKVDDKTWKDSNITVGDSIQGNVDNFQSGHAGSVSKR